MTRYRQQLRRVQQERAARTRPNVTFLLTNKDSEVEGGIEARFVDFEFTVGPFFPARTSRTKRKGNR